MGNKIKILICFLLISILANGDPEHYKFIRLDIDNGLSDNQVNSFLKDKSGFMWIGTNGGLNRFDGQTFKSFKYAPTNPNSIQNNFINKLFEDNNGDIWIGSRGAFQVFDPRTEKFSTDNELLHKNIPIPITNIADIFRDRNGNIWFVNSQTGLYQYNLKTDSVILVRHTSEKPNSISSNQLSSIGEDSDGNFWIISIDGILEKLNPKTFLVTNRFTIKSNPEGINSFRLFIDSDDDIWVFNQNIPYGVSYLKKSASELEIFNSQSTKYKLSNDLISEIVQDDNGIIWIATDHGGINLIDKKTSHIEYLMNNPDDEHSLSQNSVIGLYKDNHGIIWAGTFKRGFNYYHEDLLIFKHVKHQPSNPGNSLPFNDVNCFTEDKEGNLWIGTNGGGLIYYDRKNERFTTYRHQSENPASLSNDIIIGLNFDHQGILWIGTYFGGLNCFDGKKFQTFRNNPLDRTSLSDDRVWEIFEDSRQNLWIGTLGGGLNLFDREKKVFYHYRLGDTNSVSSNYILSIMEDRNKDLWFGTADGLNKLNNATGRFESFTSNPTVSGGLSSNNIITTFEDSRGFLWIGTKYGLDLFNKKDNTFRVFRENEGLPDSHIQTILEDLSGHLWISTTNGLSKLSITSDGDDDYTFRFKNYDVSEGLQGKEFNENAALKTHTGELIFGGANGFNIFIPEKIKENKYLPEIIFTGLSIFDQNVQIGAQFNKRIILTESLNYQKGITLRYNENVFTIGISALSYFHPENNQYEYNLEGFSNQWLKADPKSRTATFTNLDPGEYLLRVRASNNDGYWTEMKTPMKITILPPFWKTKIAFSIYILLFALVLLGLRQIILERERLKFKAEQEHKETERIQHLDSIKTRFFTNISHEFRTPLSLILTPLEKLIKNAPDGKEKNQLIFIHRNARRLLGMVNQLLDFRKTEVQTISLSPTWGELIAFIKDLSSSFYDLAENKNLKFNFSSNYDTFFTFFDHDKVERVVSNLLSNAFKYTPENGSVALDIRITDEPENTGTTKMASRINITVKDTGIGISADKINRIFDRFFQDEIPGSMINQGSGIGLSLVKEYLKVLNGDVNVESEPGKGSSFSIWFMLERFSKEQITKNNTGASITQTTEIFQQGAEVSRNSEIVYNQQKNTILLVEDNEDFRFYLKDNLRESFNVLEAANGKIGWQETLNHNPDLIVSDIMMPEMDGIELCKKLKSDPRSSHIPIILLTAKASTDQQVEGISTGADDYITKPFDFQILESRIQNLIQTRENLRKSYQSMIGLDPEKIKVDSLDEKFIRDAVKAVQQNISNADYTVVELGQVLGMSRVSLYKKILALTAKTPIEFIRIIRMKRAAQLLKESHLSISEIAYEVGFNSPRIFSGYFKDEYKILPSEYIVKNRKPHTPDKPQHLV